MAGPEAAGRLGCQRSGEQRIQPCQVGTQVAEFGRRGWGTATRGRAGEQDHGGGRQRILVGAPVGLGAGELFGRHKSGRVARRAVGSGYAEAFQQDPGLALPRIRHHDVGGFDVAVDEPALMGIVEGGVGNRSHDLEYLADRQDRGKPIAHQLPDIDALDVVHRDPQPAVQLTVGANLHDVRVIEPGRDRAVALESPAECVIRRPRLRKDLEHLPARKAGFANQIALTGRVRAQPANHGVAGIDRTVVQRHFAIVARRE